jgi:hypothetical protein
MANINQGPHGLVVDTATDSTTIATTNITVRLYGVYINTTLSAHTVVIEDGAGNALFTIPASAAAGTMYDFKGVRMQGLIIDPNDSSTGNITVLYEKVAPQGA